MRLVWVVIPLVLIGIIGMQESIAEESAPIPPPKGSVDYTISNLPKLGETAEITITATLQFLDTFDSRLGIHFDKSYFEIVSGDLSYVGENLDYDGKAIVAYGKNIIYLKDQPQTVTVTVKAIKTGLSEITISSGLDYAKHSIDMVIGESETRYATDEDFMQIFEAEKAKRLAEYGETLDNCDNLVQLPSGPDFIINSTSQYVCNDSKIINTLSPKKQLEFGVTPVDIICKEGLELIFKSSDNSPACVKPATAEKLIERGWAIGENGYGYFEPQYLPIRIIDAYENSLEPTESVCVPEQIEMTRMNNPVEFNFPTVLPAKYKLERITDIDPNYGLVQMIYTFGECGKDTTPTAVQKGSLQIYVQDIEVKIRDKVNYDPTYEDEALVQQELDKIRSEWESASIRYDPENVHPTKYVITVDGQEEIQEFKHESTFRTINGHVAKIIEPGYTTEQYWDYNADQFLYAEVVQHPGQISFYSEDFRTFYSIKGFFSADELFQIAKSIE